MGSHLSPAADLWWFLPTHGFRIWIDTIILRGVITMISWNNVCKAFSVVSDLFGSDGYSFKTKA